MPEKRSCPDCGSSNVEPKHEDTWGFRFNPDTWKCNECGYQGFMPETGEQEETDTETGQGTRQKPVWGRYAVAVLLLTLLLYLFIYVHR